MSTDFDHFKDNYRRTLDEQIAFSGQDSSFFTEMKARILINEARKFFGSVKDLRALDLGCGIGATDTYVAASIKMLHGVDVAPGVIEVAAATNPSVDYRCYDGSSIPFPDATFDLIFAINVLHHIAPKARLAAIREMRRAVRPGGLILIFEHNPLNPITAKVVQACPFDEDAILLRMTEVRDLFRAAGLSLIDRAYFLFFPWRGRLFEIIEHGLRRLPLGAQYFVAARA
ncbi:MAG: class I SAM-dependent methyltransferase [Elusimicrobiota bacterium]